MSDEMSTVSVLGRTVGVLVLIAAVWWMCRDFLRAIDKDDDSGWWT